MHHLDSRKIATQYHGTSESVVQDPQRQSESLVFGAVISQLAKTQLSIGRRDGLGGDRRSLGVHQLVFLLPLDFEDSNL